jgi:PTH1 family peptidyl-tRNA hydrolase
VGEAARFYKIPPEDIIVFYDELDLAPGKLRVKIGGGAAGHNGIRSIDAHIGNSFKRVRIGIGHPGDKSRVTKHVLGDFAKSDQDWLAPMLDAIASEAAFLAEPDGNRFATAVAQKLAPAKKDTEPKSASGEQATKARPAGAKPEHGANALTDALKKLLGDKK